MFFIKSFIAFTKTFHISNQALTAAWEKEIQKRRTQPVKEAA